MCYPNKILRMQLTCILGYSPHQILLSLVSRPWRFHGVINSFCVQWQPFYMKLSFFSLPSVKFSIELLNQSSCKIIIGLKLSEPCACTNFTIQSNIISKLPSNNKIFSRKKCVGLYMFHFMWKIVKSTKITDEMPQKVKLCWLAVILA